MKTRLIQVFDNNSSNQSFGIFNRGKRIKLLNTRHSGRAEIGKTTLFRIWDDFIELGIVNPTRMIVNAKLYKLNIENVLSRKWLRCLTH